MDKIPFAIFLMGPTASGKTDLAIKLVQQSNCEIISVDSALVYRGLDIGTAKPNQHELSLAPHRLIDVCEPSETYSVAKFREDALHEMRLITQSGKIPLLVGGTMLYFRALQNGLSPLPESDPGIRAVLQEEANQSGWIVMHQQLLEIDPEAGARIHPNDPQRILRALEVFRISGQTLSKLQAENRGDALPYRVLKLARAPADRAVLHQRIEQRFLKMLDDGFEAEVKALWLRGDLTTDLPAMRSVGYRQMLKYILGEWDYPTMVEKGIVATRQLAKRQYTWLRSEPEVNWLDESSDILAQALKKIEAARI